MTRTDLKPCPFCGGEAWVIQILEDLYAVECRKCWTRTGTYQPTKAEAIEAWNRRAERTAKGEWMYKPNEYDGNTYECSRCGEPWTLIEGTPKENNMNYCPNCGAKLDWSE